MEDTVEQEDKQDTAVSLVCLEEDLPLQTWAVGEASTSFQLRRLFPMASWVLVAPQSTTDPLSAWEVCGQVRPGRYATTHSKAVTPPSYAMAPHMSFCLPWLLDATPDANGPEMAPGAQHSMGSSSAWPFSFCCPPTPASRSWKVAEKSLCWLAGGGHRVTLGRRWEGGITLDSLEEKVKGKAMNCRI